MMMTCFRAIHILLEGNRREESLSKAKTMLRHIVFFFVIEILLNFIKERNSALAFHGFLAVVNDD